jgi:hypothetical protein
MNAKVYVYGFVFHQHEVIVQLTLGHGLVSCHCQTSNCAALGASEKKGTVQSAAGRGRFPILVDVYRRGNYLFALKKMLLSFLIIFLSTLLIWP